MKSTYIKLVTGSLLSFVLMSGACSKKEISCDGSPATYNKDIKTLVDNNCAGCHKTLNTYEGLKPILDNGKFEEVVITERSMPKGGKFDIEELIKIKCWLDNGAKEM